MTGPTPSAGPLPQHRQRVVYTLMAGLLLVTLALYWPATRNGFVSYDDPDYVSANPYVQAGLAWEGLKHAFSTPTCFNWHPLTMLSHMLDCQLFGLKPWGHHLTSLLLHALNAVLLFALLRQLTGATWRSLIVAALFAVHPLRVQSVAWVAERKDVLSGFFGLLTLIFYARYAQAPAQSPIPIVRHQASKVQSQKAVSPGPAVADDGPPASPFLPGITPHASGPYLASLFCYALGLMSKAMLVTWPFLMLLLDYWPLERFKRNRTCRLVREKLPFFVLAAAASVLTFAVQKHAGFMTAAQDVPLSARCGNALISYSRYLGKLFWPADLAVFYPHPQHWQPLYVLLSACLLLSLSWWVLAQRRRHPFLLAGWLGFLGTLVPVIGLVQVGEQSMADRYTYLPLIGVLVLAVWGVHELARGSRYPVIAVSAAASVAILVCMGLTRQELGHWRESEILFRRALAVTTDNAVVHLALGKVLDEKGQTDAAIGQLREVVRLRPHYIIALNALGGLLVKQGQLDEAITQYRAVVRLKPGQAEAQYNLGIVLLQKDQVDEAITQFQQAIRLKPDYVKAHFHLGVAFGKQGQLDQAIRQCQEVLRLKPDFTMAHNLLGLALIAKGRIGEAISHYQEAIRLKPDYVEAQQNLTRALQMKTLAGP